MEKQNYQELIDNLKDPNKIKEATTKKINASETFKQLKEYYHKISHDDYYAAKAKLDQNVELKKTIREKIKKLEQLKNRTTLSDEEDSEITKINKLLANRPKSPKEEKMIIEKMNQIEESLRELRILIKNSFE